MTDPTQVQDPPQAPVVIVIGLIWSEGRLLITRRPEGSHLAGYWEFPGGKVEAGESLHEALQREIREEVGFSVRIGGAHPPLTYTYPERTVRLHPFDCYPIVGHVTPSAPLVWRWVSPSELGAYRFPPANESLIASLSRQ